MAKNKRGFNGVVANRERIQKELDERNAALKAERKSGSIDDSDDDFEQKVYARKSAPKTASKPQSSAAPISGNTQPLQTSVAAEVGETKIGRTVEFRYVDSAKIRAWSHKDRLESELLDDPVFQELCTEVEQVGVIQSVILRRLPEPDQDGYEYEEIAGFKRVTAAKLYNQSVPAEIRELSDVEAFRLQVAENKGRSNPSFWSQALAFSKLGVEFGETQQARAENVGFTKSQASTAIRLVKTMPQDIRDSLKLHRFGYNALVALIGFLEPDRPHLEQRIDLVVEHADEFDEKPAKAQALIKRLANELEKANQASVATGEKANRPIVVKSQYGKAMTIKSASSGYSVTLHESVKGVANVDEIQKVLSDYLQTKGLKLSSSQDGS